MVPLEEDSEDFLISDGEDNYEDDRLENITFDDMILELELYQDKYKGNIRDAKLRP